MHRGYQGKGGRMRSNAIQFYSSNNTEVLRLSKDGITANPEIPVDEAAKLVLAAIDSNIKFLVQKAVEEEREASAKHAEDFLTKGRSPLGRAVGEAIRTRGQA